jgi:precorrin isomerase
MIPLTEAERGYLAGFLDGEGEVSANIQTCGVKFNNTNMEVLKWIHSKLRVGRIIRTKKNLLSIKHKRCYAVMAFGEEAKIILEELIPYLIIKKRQAELVLSYPIGFRGCGRSKQITSSIHQRKREIIRELRILNKRGPSPFDIEPIAVEPQMTLFS